VHSFLHHTSNQIRFKAAPERRTKKRIATRLNFSLSRPLIPSVLENHAYILWELNSTVGLYFDGRERFSDPATGVVGVKLGPRGFRNTKPAMDLLFLVGSGNSR
jgi:hypothetical protein